MFLDTTIVALAPILALLTQLDTQTGQSWGDIVDSLPVIVFMRLTTFSSFGLYSRLWRYASIRELIAIVGAVTLSSLFIIGYMTAINVFEPISLYFLTGFYNIFLIWVSRGLIRIVHSVRWNSYGTHMEGNILSGE